MKLLITALCFLPITTFAHIDETTYVGKTANGIDCDMTSLGTYFENNMKHPLNERVKLVVNGITFIVQHPAIIDETKPVAGFDHDQFKGYVANKKGADALVVKMDHTAQTEGPSEFYLITHQYNPDSRQVFKCSGLVKK